MQNYADSIPLIQIGQIAKLCPWIAEIEMGHEDQKSQTVSTSSLIAKLSLWLNELKIAHEVILLCQWKFWNCWAMTNDSLRHLEKLTTILTRWWRLWICIFLTWRIAKQLRTLVTFSKPNHVLLLALHPMKYETAFVPGNQ